MIYGIPTGNKVSREQMHTAAVAAAAAALPWRMLTGLNPEQPGGVATEDLLAFLRRQFSQALDELDRTFIAIG